MIIILSICFIITIISIYKLIAGKGDTIDREIDIAITIFGVLLFGTLIICSLPPDII